jgi:tripartite-type tricarboxylate transporter receptor subunit TctC
MMFRSFCAFATLLAFVLLSQAAAETKYPTKPVRIVVPFAAGGIADITARVVADRLSQKLGRRFYVENQPGAGGITAARTVMSSAPDGDTLTLLTNGTAVSVSLFEKLPFDPVNDFVPISSLGYFDFIFATNAESGVKSPAELFKTEAGIDFQIVPYRSTPDLLASLMQGNVALAIDGYSSMKGNLAENKMRAVASSGASRSHATPDVPTVRESGVGNYDVVSWNALFARAGTPEEIVKMLNGALQEILAESDVKKQLLDLGIEARASTPEEIAGRLASDIVKWRGVIERAGVAKQ